MGWHAEYALQIVSDGVGERRLTLKKVPHSLQ
jgi:hypothetical protein